MQGILKKSSKKGAVTPQYVSPNQLTLCGFETPFEQALTSENRWVKLSKHIPWDQIVGKYDMQFKSDEGRPPISGRVVIGAVIIKHLIGLTDRETILQIQENMFLQYFLGYSSFTNEAPFSPSLFVLIRERLSADILMGINDIVVSNHFDKENDNISKRPVEKDREGDGEKADQTAIKLTDVEEKLGDKNEVVAEDILPVKNQGKLLMDATV
ncbi:MAG: transposase, partial [Ferruginibacter sp.]